MFFERYHAFNKYKYACLLYFALMVFCTDCKPKNVREHNNVQINISPGAHHEILIDTDNLMLADSIQEMKLSIGQHSLRIGESAILFEVKEKEQVLINPSLDTIIMEEVVYNMVYNGLPTGAETHYQSPITIFSLGGLKYAGPYKVFVNEPMVKGWDFGIGQKPFTSLDWDDPEFKGAFQSSYYKINSTSEFRATKVSMNYINEWIEPKVLSNVISIEPGYKLTVEQGNFLIVSTPADGKVSVCKVSTDINNDLVIREVTWYNKVDHGQIIQTIAVMDNCLLQEDIFKKKNKLEIVLSDNSHQPHLRIVK